MRIVTGNWTPQAYGIPAPSPAISVTGVTDIQNEDGSYLADYIVGSDAPSIRKHLTENPGYTTHLPGNGVVIQVVRCVAEQSHNSPAFVAVIPDGRDPDSAADLERFLADYWGCDRGVPDDVEDVYHTENGPPGTGPGAGE